MMRAFILSALLCCLLALGIFGCNGSNPFDLTSTLPVGRVQAINIIPGILWIGEGDTYRFEARGIFPGGAIGDVTFLATWSSTDPDIAPIIGPGLVRAERPGLAYVTCTYDGVKSSTGTVAIPGVPLEKGIVPIHVEVYPGSVNIPIMETGVLTYIPAPATPAEMALPFPKPALQYILGDANKTFADDFYAGSTLRMTSGGGAGIEFEITGSFTSPYDTVPSDVNYPFGHDWLPDGIGILEIDTSKGFPFDLGIVAGDTYEVSKRWVQFDAVVDFSDGTKGNVTNSSNWHLSDPTYGYITPGGVFRSTSAEPTNLVIYCEYSGLVSNYVPISVR